MLMGLGVNQNLGYIRNVIKRKICTKEFDLFKLPAYLTLFYLSVLCCSVLCIVRAL